jgi:S-formylglutathione hydrolase FrmB
MRTETLLLATLATFVVPLFAQNPGGGNQGGDRPRRERREQPRVELKNLTFKTESLKSTAVSQTLEFGVYLPKDYDADANKDRKWPLVIWLHGMFEDHLRFHQRGGAEVLDRCVGDGKLPPCVFVTANGGSTSMYVNRKDQRWEDLITQDLLEHVTKNYRVAADREHRAIMGVSMGGMAALRIAFKHSDVFGAVGAHSSAVFAEDPDKLPERMKGMASRIGLDEVFGKPIQKEPWQQANPLCLANSTDTKVLSTLRIYFDAGTDDRYGFAVGNELLHKALDAKKVEHTWRLIDGGGHSWGAGFQDQTLPHSFAMVGAMFRGEKADGKPAEAGASKDEKAAGNGK